MRTDWTFAFNGSAVAEAATAKVAYHRDRTAYWDNEIAKAENAIRSGGIDIRRYENTVGHRNEVIIDPNLAGRLSEAQSKRESHERKAGEYADWAAVLKLDPEKLLDLSFEDVLHFGLAEWQTLPDVPSVPTPRGDATRSRHLRRGSLRT